MQIRVATDRDAAAVAAIYAPYVCDTAITFEIDPPPASEIQRRITTCLTTYPWLVAEDGDRIAGYVYGGRFSGRAAYDWSVEITAYLHPDYHRQGLGSRLYRALFGLLRRQGFHGLYAGITLPNAASIGLHTAIGMTEVGVYREVGFKAGCWHDVAWYGMAISPATPPATRPVPFTRLGPVSPEQIEQWSTPV